MVRILGIDPGSVKTGYGIIESNGQQSRYVHSGHLKLPVDSLASKLGQIFSELSNVIDEYQPEHMAIEQVFLSKNAASALKLGHARGAAMTAGVNAKLEIFEYSAKSVKQSTVGYGAASKEQIQHMILRLLNIRKVLQEDEADALAVALCHAHTSLSPQYQKNIKASQ
ncbi:MAG: crossover junction endodeoxyribonuclease RuvC [Gammaproteobacteria bacterium]|nr:crossover junction endodeoxyribonuclease RuvC [Gammaproteobacteria bacterium]